MNPWSLALISFVSIIFSILISSLLSAINRRKKGIRIPPGPRGIPFLGYLPFLGRQPYKTFMKLGETYGDVFQLKLGRRELVVLNSLDVIRDSLGKDFACAGRPDFASFETVIRSGGQARVPLRTAGPMWKFLRKTAVKALSLFATSKNSKLEAVVQDASDTMFSHIDSQRHKPFEVRESAFKTISGVMGAVTFGGQLDSESPLLKHVIVFTDRISQFVKVGSVLDFLPFGSLIMRGQIRKFERDIAPLNEFTENAIRNHVCSDEVRDIADALHKTVNDTPEEEKKALGLRDFQIKALAQDLFSAGFATTMETFRWAINLLCKFSDKQTKLQEELDRVLQGRRPTLFDRDNLPYCEAVLLEVFRFSSIVPLALPHFTICDTEIRGYFVPKHTLIFPNLYGHHHNPKVFENPDQFRPERFITPDGELDSDEAQKILAFSTGKRRCIGENLARQELALLLARTYQKYKVRAAPGVHIDPSACIPGLTRAPVGWKMVFTPRGP